MISVKCVGSEGFTNQVDRIREGFNQLNNVKLVASLDDANMVYINNPWYDDYIIPQLNNYNVKKIFNVLDIPEHLFPDYPLGKLKHQLSQADRVTCISKTVAGQLKRIFNIDATVIYNPIKDVNYTGAKKQGYKYLYVGRACDPNKRFYLVKQAMQILGESEKTLAVCGGENPGFGDYLGVVSDKKLEELYNSVDFVFLPSRFEGIGLTMIEGAICGAIPIVTNDNPTVKEFFPDGRYDDVNPNGFSIAEFIRKFNDFDFRENFLYDVFGIGQLDFKNRFNKKTVAQNILDIYLGWKYE